MYIYNYNVHIGKKYRAATSGEKIMKIFLG